MKNLLFLFLALISVTLIGCASHGTAVSDDDPARKIVDIVIDEDPESLILGILGNQKLAHREAGQNGSKKIKLLFPATGLDGVRGRFVPPDNEIIGSITVGERIYDDTTNSIVYIGLKADSNYAVVPNENGLWVTFPKIPDLPPPAPSDNIEPQINHVRKTRELHPELPLEETLEISVPAATALQTVTTKIESNMIAVDVVADGTIKNYNSFTLIEPDRIVFDLPQIKSPHVKERKVPVQSKWIKRIRYFGHPDRLRLVIETHPAIRPHYSSSSTNNGLPIKVGTSE